MIVRGALRTVAPMPVEMISAQALREIDLSANEQLATLEELVQDHSGSQSQVDLLERVKESVQQGMEAIEVQEAG